MARSSSDVSGHFKNGQLTFLFFFFFLLFAAVFFF